MMPPRALLPDCVPWNELIRYADNHPDSWVRRLSRDSQEICNILEERGFDPSYSVAEVIDELIEERDSYKFGMEDAESDRNEACRARDTAERRVNALRYDLDHNEQARDIEALKAELIRRSDTERDLRRQLHQKDNDIADLTRQVGKLTDKLNTWTIIAT